MKKLQISNLRLQIWGRASGKTVSLMTRNAMAQSQSGNRMPHSKASGPLAGEASCADGANGSFDPTKLDKPILAPGFDLSAARPKRRTPASERCNKLQCASFAILNGALFQQGEKFKGVAA